MAAFVPAPFLSHRLQISVHFDGAIRKRKPPLDAHQSIALQFFRRRVRRSRRVLEITQRFDKFPTGMASVGHTALHPLDRVFCRFAAQLPADVMQAMNLVDTRLYGLNAAALSIELTDHTAPIWVHEISKLLWV